MHPGDTFIDDTTFTCRHTVEAVIEIDMCEGCLYDGACPGDKDCSDIIFKDRGPVDIPISSKEY